MGEPIIYIIPDLKELSKTATGGVSKHCGMMGFTNENCIGDYINGKLVKRNNYHSGSNKYPNNFLDKDSFIILDNIQFNIGDYINNWTWLFSGINQLTSGKASNVFISCHQHLLQNMFFKFQKLQNQDMVPDSCGKTMENYGFRNCTCIKISMTSNEISMKVIHSEDTGRDKFKYKYVESGTELKDILVPNTYPENNNQLNNCDIYMIRHGEAVHNLNDVYKVKKAKEECNPAEAAKIDITEGNKQMLGNMNKDTKLNALLTTQGVEQGKSLYKTLNSIINNEKQNIYISSPMDRTIQTLIYATSPDEGYFSNLRKQFLEMYKTRFPKTHNELVPLSDNTALDNSNPIQDSINETKAKRWYEKINFNPFGKKVGGKRKSKRNMKHKSKKNKRSKKVRKTRKRIRRTRKRYQKGCSRK